MRNKYLDEDISYLKLNSNLNSLFKENNILKVEDLWIKNRTFLKNIGLSDNDIKQVVIKLELIGLDLNKKKTK